MATNANTQTAGPICGWCGEQLVNQNGTMVHQDGTKAGGCADRAIKRGRSEETNQSISTR
jgi:hypothetical protein